MVLAIYRALLIDCLYVFINFSCKFIHGWNHINLPRFMIFHFLFSHGQMLVQFISVNLSSSTKLFSRPAHCKRIRVPKYFCWFEPQWKMLLQVYLHMILIWQSFINKIIFKACFVESFLHSDATWKWRKQFLIKWSSSVWHESKQKLNK